MSAQLYFVVTKESIYIPGEPGDERSRTNPGHGYPATPGYTKMVDKVITFDNRAPLEAWVRSHLGENFRVYEARELIVETKVVTSIT